MHSMCSRATAILILQAAEPWHPTHGTNHGLAQPQSCFSEPDKTPWEYLMHCPPSATLRLAFASCQIHHGQQGYTDLILMPIVWRYLQRWSRSAAFYNNCRRSTSENYAAVSSDWRSWHKGAHAIAQGTSGHARSMPFLAAHASTR